MKILLVRLSSMGDLVHTLPALTDLARHRPDISLDWLCEAAFADIARLHPFTAAAVPIRWRRWRGRLLQAPARAEFAELRRRLRAAHYDWVLDSQGLLKSAAFARLAGAPVTGLDAASAREPWAARLYSRRIAVDTERDAVWRNRSLFAQAFGYNFDGEADFGLQNESRLPETPPYLAVLHAASRPEKLWPQTHWRELITRWHGERGAAVKLLWGSAAERRRAEELAAGFDFAEVCPRLTLAQAAQVLRGAAAVAGADTGLLHLADALGVPVVGVYTASNPAKTGVQASARARNVGGGNGVPTTDDVWTALMEVVS